MTFRAAENHRGRNALWSLAVLGCWAAWSASTPVHAGVGADINTAIIRQQMRAVMTTIEGELRCASQTEESKSCALQIRDTNGRTFAVSENSRAGLEMLSSVGARVRVQGELSENRANEIAVHFVERLGS